MRGHWTVAIVAFLLGVMLANRIGFLAPISGQKA
jgi:hypothetical protein